VARPGKHVVVDDISGHRERYEVSTFREGHGSHAQESVSEFSLSANGHQTKARLWTRLYCLD
jgi:hypothetical protein